MVAVKKGPPSFYKKMKAQYPEVFRSYEDLTQNVQNQGPIDQKYRYLSKLGIAIGMDHESSIKIQIKKSLEFGASRDEILHIILLSVTMVGFSRMMAALAVADQVFTD